jgi:hypothetical protein
VIEGRGGESGLEREREREEHQEDLQNVTFIER